MQYFVARRKFQVSQSNSRRGKKERKSVEVKEEGGGGGRETKRDRFRVRKGGAGVYSVCTQDAVGGGYQGTGGGEIPRGSVCRISACSSAAHACFFIQTSAGAEHHGKSSNLFLGLAVGIH